MNQPFITITPEMYIGIQFTDDHDIPCGLTCEEYNAIAKDAKDKLGRFWITDIGRRFFYKKSKPESEAIFRKRINYCKDRVVKENTALVCQARMKYAGSPTIYGTAVTAPLVRLACGKVRKIRDVSEISNICHGEVG